MTYAKQQLLKILSTPIFPHECADPTEVVADYLLDNDVVPVVRCKDCEHWNERHECERFSTYGLSEFITDITHATNPDGYCSQGVRRARDEQQPTE